jgi:hypothetical protein
VADVAERLDRQLAGLCVGRLDFEIGCGRARDDYAEHGAKKFRANATHSHLHKRIMRVDQIESAR